MKNELPDGWEWKKLGESLLFSKNGLSSSQNSEKTGMPVTRIETISDGTINFSKIGYINDLSEENIEKHKLVDGDILFSHINSLEHIGKTAIFEDHDNLLLHGVNLLLLRPNQDIIYPKYLHYLCRNLRNLKYFWTIANKSVNQASINQTRLLDISIPVPSLETQHTIVAIIQKAEETKKLRAQADELTQRLLQSVFLEMFGDPVENPKEWNTKKLDDLCLNIYGGGTPSKSKSEYYDGEIPWVTPKDMKQDFIFDSIDHISEDAIENSSTKIIPSGSLLMVIRSGILKKKLPVAINTCDVTLNQDMKGFIFDKNLVNPLFMLYYFKSYQKYLLSRVRSVTADNLEFQQIKTIEVILPHIELQNKFAIIVEKLKQINEQQKQSSLELENLFNTLMQKAFKGELVS